MHRTTSWSLAVIGVTILSATAGAQSVASPLTADLTRRIAALEPKVIAWRRDIHQHPELGNRETRTAKLVADHLRSLGLEVQTGVAHTGVVALLKGGQPGPVVLLRADMDALPVTERVDVPFASKVRATYNGQEVGVMHACGHDTHVAILMGVAEALAPMRAQLPGTIKFVFQPAEEGAPQGEKGGAELMVAEGVLDNPKVDAAFALHIDASREAGTIGWSTGAKYASADDFRIVVQGRQTHGGYPWNGVDPVVASAQIVSALQTIVSRNMTLTRSPAVVTVGSIRGGVRSNIIPESVEMLGTIRALDTADRRELHERVRKIATGVGESMGTTVEIQLPYTTAYPVTANDESLLRRVVPVLEAVAGAANVQQEPPVTGAEDFSFIAERVPSVYIGLGGRPKSVRRGEAADHHTPDFYVDDSELDLGVKALIAMALEAMRTIPRT